MLGSNVDYTPTCDWPEDCMVQWGHGIIPAVPFFEAFPQGTFIRGEGKDIAEAEARAFAQWRRDQGCAHLWGRLHPSGKVTYTNGAAWCCKCGGFRSRMFNEVVVLGHWRKPLTIWEHDYLVSLETDHEMNTHMDEKYPEDKERRHTRRRVLRLRMNLFGKVEE